MKIRWLLLYGTLMVVAMGAIDVTALGAGDDQEDAQEGLATMYANYEGHGLEIPVSFQYPEGWSVEVERGKIETYRQIRIMGPRNADDSYACYIAVQEFPLKGAGGKFDGVEGLIENYKRYLFDGAVVESETKRELAGVDAADTTVTYTIPPLHMHGLKPIAVPVKARALFFEKNSRLYEIIYSADAREYARYSAAFDHLLETLRLNK